VIDDLIFYGRTPTPPPAHLTKKQQNKLAALRRRTQAVRGVKHALAAEEAARRLRCGEQRHPLTPQGLQLPR
jgi:hypothetical protein